MTGPLAIDHIGLTTPDLDAALADLGSHGAELIRGPSDNLERGVRQAFVRVRSGETIELLMPFPNVTVFYGHIHQEHNHMTGHIAHHAAKSLIFPLPAPGSQPANKPQPWDPEHPYRGLGWRDIEAWPKRAEYEIREMQVQGG